jgi:hypothetical protein
MHLQPFGVANRSSSSWMDVCERYFRRWQLKSVKKTMYYSVWKKG